MINFARETKSGVVKVFLDKKHVGNIRNVEGGYQYFPKGHKEGGEVFKTMFDCKNSLFCD